MRWITRQNVKVEPVSVDTERELCQPEPQHLLGDKRTSLRDQTGHNHCNR
jgi:hypothetical protein